MPRNVVVVGTVPDSPYDGSSSPRNSAGICAPLSTAHGRGAQPGSQRERTRRRGRKSTFPQVCTDLLREAIAANPSFMPRHGRPLLVQVFSHGEMDQQVSLPADGPFFAK